MFSLSCNARVMASDDRYLYVFCRAVHGFLYLYSPGLYESGGLLDADGLTMVLLSFALPALLALLLLILCPGNVR